MLYALKSHAVYTGNEVLNSKALIIENDKIISIVDSPGIPGNAEIVDYEGYMMAPGLIDLQIAGGGAYLFSENPTAEALEAITESIVKSGTAGFLIAVPTNSFDAYREMFEVLRNNPHPAVLGLHLEGPYINKERGGAHKISYIRRPDINELRTLLDEAGGLMKMMTLAPELCDADFIELLNAYGIVVAAGHSNANFIEAMAGFGWGVRTSTHLFNAMTTFHHRDPGLPGATFMTKNAYASIIADGIHVDYSVVSLAKIIMKERLFLVSDAVEENAGGAYPHVGHDDRFTLPDGTLSGSRLNMLQAVRNCVEHAGIPLDEALRMGSSYPARLMGSSEYGYIREGYKANITVFDDNYSVKQVIIDGRFCL
ncbi:MAG: N-acetylglucosamine-6-phosphate deacetylase [Bacteroidales bacterium]|nr:N-acetylglucosamine-6-phosphate deacetylase [Bacteroidales bacterium]